jgi:hypothetical protein
MCSSLLGLVMADYLYLYDCKHARQSNARRVAFTKELYGFTYSWKTKSGIKERKKIGLLDECWGSKSVADSAIFVPGSHKALFDSLFESYEDILSIHIYEVIEEIR